MSYDSAAYERYIDRPENREGDPFLRGRLIQLIQEYANYIVNQYTPDPPTPASDLQKWAMKVRDKQNSQGAIDAYYQLVDMIVSSTTYTQQGGRDITDANLDSLMQAKVNELLKV